MRAPVQGRCRLHQLQPCPVHMECSYQPPGLRKIRADASSGALAGAPRVITTTHGVVCQPIQCPCLSLEFVGCFRAVQAEVGKQQVRMELMINERQLTVTAQNKDIADLSAATARLDAERARLAAAEKQVAARLTARMGAVQAAFQWLRAALRASMPSMAPVTDLIFEQGPAPRPAAAEGGGAAAGAAAAAACQEDDDADAALGILQAYVTLSIVLMGEVSPDATAAVISGAGPRARSLLAAIARLRGAAGAPLPLAAKLPPHLSSPGGAPPPLPAPASLLPRLNGGVDPLPPPPPQPPPLLGSGAAPQLGGPAPLELAGGGQPGSGVVLGPPPQERPAAGVPAAAGSSGAPGSTDAPAPPQESCLTRDPRLELPTPATRCPPARQLDEPAQPSFPGELHEVDHPTPDAEPGPES